jgi:hypothetical protein
VIGSFLAKKLQWLFLVSGPGAKNGAADGLHVMPEAEHEADIRTKWCIYFAST